MSRRKQDAQNEMDIALRSEGASRPVRKARRGRVNSQISGHQDVQGIVLDTPRGNSNPEAQTVGHQGIIPR